MSELPPNLSGGAPWATPNDVNMVRQFTLMNSAASGSPGMRRQSFGGGTILKRIEQIKRRGGGASVSTHPFKLSEASDGATLKVRIKFGMVNSLTPGGMGDVAEPDLILTVTATKYVVLDVTTSTSGLATSAAISLETTVAADTATSGKQALGLVTYTAAAGAVPASIAFSQVVAGSLRHQRCGSTQHLFGSV